MAVAIPLTSSTRAKIESGLWILDRFSYYCEVAEISYVHPFFKERMRRPYSLALHL